MSKQELNNPQKSGVILHDEERVAISESSLLVPLAKIKQLDMKALLTHLNIIKPKKFALIESLDYFGKDTRPKKAGSSR
ncbi:MAG: hypothetical protein PHD43_06090 [Methylococcales bacterium]|nr:hypothetical protein [Methylococcales bacterium]